MIRFRFSVNCFAKVFTALFPVCQAEIESRVELEKRLKQAEEALQNLEKGLNSVERTKERDEQMKGDVTQLRSEQKFFFSQFVGGNSIGVVVWRPPLDRVRITSGLERNTITLLIRVLFLRDPSQERRAEEN